LPLKHASNVVERARDMSALSGSKTTAFPWKNPNWFSKRIVERPEPSNRFERAAIEFYKVAKASYRRARKRAAAASI
jgi:hypothetical protein